MEYFLKLKKAIKYITNYLKDLDRIFICLNKYKIIIVTVFKQ